MKSGDKKNLPCWNIHKLSQLLHEIQLLLRIVLRSMFKHLAKLINEYHEELALLLGLVVNLAQSVKHIVSRSVDRQLVTHQRYKVFIVAYYLQHIKLCFCRQSLRIQKTVGTITLQILLQGKQKA